MIKPRCPYCSKESELVNGDKIYPHRADLALKRFYACFDCQAWVGCHPKTIKPLGALANAETRRWRSKAHAAFDPLWIKTKKRKKQRRREAYQWLASQLQIDADDCHIGHMDASMCKKVVSLCAE